MIVTGLRWVGKTVLLGRFREAALARAWVVVEVEARRHDDLGFRGEIARQMRIALTQLSAQARWTERLMHAAGVLKSFSARLDHAGAISFGIEIEPAIGHADSADLAADLTDLFIAVGEVCA